MIDMNTYEREFWKAYHGKPTPPETKEEREEVTSLLRELAARRASPSESDERKEDGR